MLECVFIFNVSLFSFTDTVAIAEWFTVMGSVTAHALKQSIVYRIPVRARPYGLCICSLLVSSFIHSCIKNQLANSVQPQLYDAKTSFIYVTEQELLTSLKMTVLGISSPLHTWDSSSEKFVQSGTGNNEMRNSIIVDGKDETVSSRQGLFLSFRL